MAILVNESTRVVVQGITGREGTALTRQSLDYGTQIVAGVTPGKGGVSVYGVPVYDSLRRGLREHPVDASVICVPPAFVRDAALEAISNDLPLIVIVTERVPRRDVAEVLAFARAKETRVIGPNSLGLISPGRVKVGMVGGPAEDVRRAYTPGSVAVLSRSGGMTTELSDMLTQAGIGQSTCVSVGGDPIVGSTFVDLLALLEADVETEAVVIYGEPGGVQEETLADHVARQGTRLPIIAFLGGRFVDQIPGQRFGHAAVIVEAGRGSVAGKVDALHRAGIRVAEHLSDVPRLISQTLAG